MTMPIEFAHASQQFDRFVDELRIRLDHETRHQTFQTIQSVLRVFRRRLSVADGLRFADALQWPNEMRALRLVRRFSSPDGTFNATHSLIVH
jgi:uncharacterized protein (DUF2267 family)